MLLDQQHRRVLAQPALEQEDTVLQAEPLQPDTRVRLGTHTSARDDTPLLVARVETLGLARGYLRRLASGDATVLGELDVVTEGAYDTQAHEWGIGVDREEGGYVLVRGGPNQVKWSHKDLVGFVGIAHSHSAYPKEAFLPGPRGKKGPRIPPDPEIPDMTLDDIRFWGVDLPERTIVTLLDWFLKMGSKAQLDSFVVASRLMPSNSDMNANWTASLDGGGVEELIELPYRVRSDGWISIERDAPTGPGGGNGEGPGGDPWISVAYGPVLAVLKPNWRELNTGDSELVVSYHAPVRVMAGKRLDWSAVITMEDTNPDYQPSWLERAVPEGAVDRKRLHQMMGE